MAQVAVTLNNRDYVVTCDDGEQEHVLRLARVVDDKVTALAKAIGQVGEARLLAMASVILADELEEARAAKGKPAPRGDDAALDALARRVEALAARLEST
jgi:cell division protein ZapA